MRRERKESEAILVSPEPTEFLAKKDPEANEALRVTQGHWANADERVIVGRRASRECRDWMRRVH